MKLYFYTVLFLVFTNYSFSQTTRYVNSSSGNDLNAGTLASPYKTFHKAYTVAVAGDIINLTGTFDWTDVDETGDATGSGYTISKNITIQGQAANSTFIQAANSDDIADRRVFSISNGYTVIINNCSIRYGKTSDGGGVQVDGIATIESCDLSYNRATGGSGGGLNCRGKATINNSLIRNNFAWNMGGGVNRDYYSGNGGTPSASDVLVITNSTIAYNQVLANLAYFDGGGVFYRRGAGTITNSVIAYNKVTNADVSTNGIGTGDPSSVVNLKNNIIANNFRYNCWSGDIGQRQNSSSGSYVDNGFNIFGVKGYWSQGLTVASTSWLDHISNCSTPDGVFVLQDGQNCRSGQLYLSTTFGLNASTNGVANLELTDSLSIAINNGSSLANALTSIPNNDMRGFPRVGSIDIGSFEFQSIVAPFAAPVPGSVSSSQLICLNGTASDIILTGSVGSIQWQSSTDKTTWTNVSGATSATLTSAQIGAVTGTKYYRANVTNSGCSATSNTAFVNVNNALAFDGSGDFVPLGTNAVMNFTSNFTIESWVYVPATPKYSINAIFSKNYPNLGTPGFMFGFNNWNTTDLLLVFEPAQSAFASTRPISAGQWNHVAAVISGNGTLLTFYINGKTAGSNTISLVDASSVNEFIGAMDASGSYSLQGTLNELRIWNVARTQQELIDNMDNSLVGNETGLVAYYDFNQGTPGGTNTSITSVLNKTSNALHGTFTGISRTGTASNFVDGNHASIVSGDVACINGNSVKLIVGATGKTPTAIQWNKNTTNSTVGAIAISGATNQVFNTDSMESGSRYYYATISGTCASSTTSNFILLQNPNVTGTLDVYEDNTTQLACTDAAAASSPWVSANTSVFTTNGTGLISGIYPGSSKLIYTTSLGCQDTVLVTVHPTEWNGSSNNAYNNGSNWKLGSMPATLKKIRFNSAASNNLILTGTSKVDTIDFNASNKMIELGNFDLVVNQIKNYNSNNYIKTTGIGKVKRQMMNNASFVFPVGKTSYNPISITNKTGTADTFSINILDTTYLNGASSGIINNPYVKRTWNISKNTASANAGSGVDLMFTWNANEVVGTLTSPSLNHYNGSGWEIPSMGTSSVSGTSLTYTGYKGTFSPFAIGGSSTVGLSVELMGFDAICNDDKTVINWTTASEKNNDRFELYKSPDAKTWTKIYTVKGQGTKVSETNYIFYDFEKQSSYYRLKDIDFNGKISESNVIASSCKDEIVSTSIYPNPASEDFILETFFEENSRYRILEMSGNQVLSGAIISQKMVVSVKGLSSGIYILEIIKKGQTEKTKLLKK